MKISKLWDMCLQFEYDEQKLIKGLDDFLRKFKNKKILDCACGTGFVILDLIKKGYDITCTDGSVDMLKEFKINTKSKNLSTKPQLLKWSELSKNFDGVFDVVMCRGSSLIYGSSWDSSKKNSEAVIRSALKNFYQCLKPGGLVYVDTTSEKNLGLQDPEVAVYKPKNINGVMVGLSEKVVTDRKRNIRIWDPVLVIGSKEYRLKRYSYFLPHETLIGIMRECGFKNIRKQKIEGEHYQVFIAEK